jgi:hypothetical protein
LYYIGPAPVGDVFCFSARAVFLFPRHPFVQKFHFAIFGYHPCLCVSSGPLNERCNKLTIIRSPLLFRTRDDGYFGFVRRIISRALGGKHRREKYRAENPSSKATGRSGPAKRKCRQSFGVGRAFQAVQSPGDIFLLAGFVDLGSHLDL